LAAQTHLLTFVLTASAMVAFAANSVLCRLALGEAAIDPYSFTAIRLVAGALTLVLVTRLRRRPQPVPAGGASWRGALFLILYALPFSLAYVRIDTGAGALLLVGSVQVTMISIGLRSGERPSPPEWIGLFGAALGVVYMVSPGVSAPHPLGAGLMVGAGVGWGLYSLAGRDAGDPALVTAGNFRRAASIVAVAAALAWPWLAMTPTGILLAAASGSLASGLGYTIWYTALKRLSATRAALVQLSLPVLAAAGGVAFVREHITPRLLIASAVILGSIALGTVSRGASR
jgi:drug/metabolite transporter (DMT)-like permease